MLLSSKLFISRASVISSSLTALIAFASSSEPYPFVLPNATFHSSVVGVDEFDIPKKYFSFVSVKDDETGDVKIPQKIYSYDT